MELSEHDRRTDEMIRQNSRPISLETKIKALAWFYGTAAVVILSGALLVAVLLS